VPPVPYGHGLPCVWLLAHPVYTRHLTAAAVPLPVPAGCPLPQRVQAPRRADYGPPSGTNWMSVAWAQIVAGRWRVDT